MADIKMSPRNVFGVLLAAGESSRMGTMKQLLNYRGRSFTYNALDGFFYAGIKTVIVVLGHEYELMKGHISEYMPYNGEFVPGCEILTAKNDIYKAGQFSSIKCGLSTFLQKKSIDFYAGFMLQLIDRPLVKPETFKIIKDEFDKASDKIIIPSYNMRRGHPVCFPKCIIGSALKLDEYKDSLKNILNENNSIISHVNVTDEGILKNIDTIDEYREINP